MLLNACSKCVNAALTKININISSIYRPQPTFQIN